MPNHEAVAIANEFLSLRADDSWPQQMYIQKLVHIANGWNMAVNGSPLVEEAPQAWDNGPVYRSLWDFIKINGYRGQHNTLVDQDNKPVRAMLSNEERDVINHVWRKYGYLSGANLSRLTHGVGSPWEKAYFHRGRNSPLDPEDIRTHYVSLALAGRESAN